MPRSFSGIAATKTIYHVCLPMHLKDYAMVKIGQLMSTRPLPAALDCRG
jgi:hypothetical protein